MKKSILLPAALFVALLGAIFLFFAPRKPQPGTAVVAPVTAPAAEPAAAEPQYPLTPPPEAATEQPTKPSADETAPPQVAATEDSEVVMARLLALLRGQARSGELLILDHFIPRFVVTVDNLAGKDLSRKQLPVKGASGPFLVHNSAEGEGIHPDNARRYSAFVALAEALDSRELVDLYVRLYPEFQKAYENLGQPKAYFNDRLIAVIDHLLATPEPTEPIRLHRPKILYQFADPDLEERGAGQKILLRVGADNRARLKAKLQSLRAELLTRVIAPAVEKTEP
ncbi:DUF3014 domain-containing protein [Trichloromonas acetexigens]|uniref:DUF3014 domain-containing protein n=1 Tax=Trichloromonas acetexigens TaxID=38815 RepID=A0A550J5B0_9BACT|nr:DUF3014 domain-containing protein [Desulfuromonas acetexigens]TRO78410.1 DUF3014 domain-containing protein [Desulfuromonas acetexigens]